MVWENQLSVIQAARIAAPQTATASTGQFWKQALSITMNLPRIVLSLFGRRTQRTPISQERLALQMLIVNGSVRASNVEFRYSTAQEETKSLSRSFAALPPSDRQNLTPFQALRARLHGRGTQLMQRLYAQETYSGLQSRGTQLMDRVREELTARSYLSRI